MGRMPLFLPELTLFQPSKGNGNNYLDFCSTGITSRAVDQRKEPSVEPIYLTLWQVLWKRILLLKLACDIMFRVSFHCQEYLPKVYLPIFAYARNTDILYKYISVHAHTYIYTKCAHAYMYTYINTFILTHAPHVHICI